jgi:hypothetical protein
MPSAALPIASGDEQAGRGEPEHRREKNGRGRLEWRARVREAIHQPDTALSRVDGREDAVGTVLTDARKEAP